MKTLYHKNNAFNLQVRCSILSIIYMIYLKLANHLQIRQKLTHYGVKIRLQKNIIVVGNTLVRNKCHSCLMP